jgi:hypothetical protein
MKRRTKWIFSIAAIVVGGIGIGALVGRIGERNRRVHYQAALAMYSRDLRTGLSRAEIELYVRSHDAWPERDAQQDNPLTDDIVVRLGEEPSPWYCSREIVFLKLQFGLADRYVGASLKPELQDCL